MLNFSRNWSHDAMGWPHPGPTVWFVVMLGSASPRNDERQAGLFPHPPLINRISLISTDSGQQDCFWGRLLRDVKSVVLCVVARLMHLTLQDPEDCLVGASSPFRVLLRAGKVESVPRFLNASWVVIGNKGRISADIDVWPTPIADHALSPLAGNSLTEFSNFSCPFSRSLRLAPSASRV